jgi:drug/metabolite transporter (DMT)-like permease
MTLDPLVLLLVLLAAVLHATWNAFVKAGGDKLASISLVVFVSSVPALFALPFLPVPAVESWPFLAISATIHFVYFGALAGAYRHGDLSQVYPIARGSAPIMVAVGAWVFEGEALGVQEWIGVVLLSLGIMSLSDPRRLLLRDHNTRAVGFALLTGLTIAVYAVADGMGVRRSGATFGFIAWLFVLSGVPMLFFTLWARCGRIAEAFGPQLKSGIFGGLLAAVAYSIAIWAMSTSPLALVVSVRETSVLMAAAIGSLFLSEPFGGRRIAAAAVIVAGATLLNLAG